jgi:translation initiation factor IF-2
LILREKKKTKVYELARALKLKEPELLSILNALGIEFSTKFSSLSDEDVNRVKTWCRENQGPDVVEERVGSGVRRRRRKVVRKEAAPQPAETASLETSSEESRDQADGTPEAEPTAPAAELSAGTGKTSESAADEKAAAPADGAAEAPAAAESDAAEGDAAPPAGEAETAAAAEAAGEEASGEGSEAVSETEPETVVSAAAPEADDAAVAAKEGEAAKAGETAAEPEKETKGAKKSASRGARVIGRVALSELDTRSSARAPRGRAKAADEVGGDRFPAAAAPVAEPASGKKGRKSKRKDAAPEGESRGRRGSKRSVIKNFNFGDERGRGRRGRGSKKKSGQKTEITVPKEIKRVIRISDVISVGDLAKKMGVKAGELIGKLMSMGTMATINQVIDYDTAVLIADEYGHTVENVAFDEEVVLETAEDNPEDLVSRPPVVTIMGHVDHGKTSLLDAIRKSRVAAGEAGGITQHIGAYMVELPNGKISFVDTPGHEAFTSMRSRGAGVTDIVILVVAADDGVMPTTVESINHAKAAGVPIIVAINKIDKDNARPDEVRRQLTEYGLVPEDWGGDTIMVEVSAKNEINLDTLLEMVLLQAEMMEIKANPNKPGSGVVLESRLDRGKGPVVTVLIQEGTVKQGDFVVAGLHRGRVRALMDDHGRQVQSAGPSTPVEVLGLSGVPDAGDDFNVVKSEKQAKELAANRQLKAREKEISKTSKISLEELFEKMEEGQVEKLNIIVKGDVQGSVEAVSEALRKQATNKVKVDIVHAAVGGVKEADVMLAAASQAIIVGFNVRPDLKAQQLAEQEKVDIRLYSVIYDLLEDIHKAMEGLLAPEIKEVYLGRAEVRETFVVSKVGTIAGCRVVDGKVKRNSRVRLLRDDVVIVESTISSLKRFKDDAREVASGFDCGIGIENYNDVKVGDVIEAFELEEVTATL